MLQLDKERDTETKRRSNRGRSPRTYAGASTESDPEGCSVYPTVTVIMQKHNRGLSGRGQYGRVYRFNGATGCFLLLLALGIVMRTVSSAGCGQPKFKQRVVGGQPSVLGKWPWMAAIIEKKSQICGGSLMSSTWVVTAAHCVSYKDAKNLFVMVGTVNITGPTYVGVAMSVKRYLVYPMYNDKTSSGDLALIELNYPVTYTAHIQPICLPAPNQDFPDGMKCWLAGWGSMAENERPPPPLTLQEVDLPLINYAACDEMFRVAIGSSSPPGMVLDTMICAGYPKGKKDGCQGDSGGPLMCQHGNYWNLVGVMSFGVGCAKPNSPGVYTKVSHFVTWIKEQINISDTTMYNMTADATTVQVNTVTTKSPIGAVHIFNISETNHEGATTLQVNTSTTKNQSGATQIVSVSKTNHEGATTPKVNTSATKNETGAIQIVSVSETSHEGATGSGVGTSMSVALLVLAVVFRRILELDIV